MPTTRISTSTHELLRRLAKESGLSMQLVIENALEAYRRQRFLERSNRAFEKLRADADAWKREERERQAWDAALADDLRDS